LSSVNRNDRQDLSILVNVSVTVTTLTFAANSVVLDFLQGCRKTVAAVDGTSNRAPDFILRTSECTENISTCHDFSRYSSLLADYR